MLGVSGEGEVRSKMAGRLNKRETQTVFQTKYLLVVREKKKQPQKVNKMKQIYRIRKWKEQKELTVSPEEKPQCMSPSQLLYKVMTFINYLTLSRKTSLIYLILSYYWLLKIYKTKLKLKSLSPLESNSTSTGSSQVK
ncbi:hypothetical protein KIL84_019013 [Mauremys mutica]|uniref:Uncharacterized protein n=1 Tax=Mauremys mutica TaxID=74926 RepID=A0A9D3XRH7_9SAUR|nr:hypothetical protein KIL84_019013 [Mauremys mutica]